ncbi:MAG: peptide ABC transporter substrate-binding protein [Lachnospiraceae bacterium]
MRKKQVLSLVLALSTVVAMTACSKGSGNDSTTGDTYGAQSDTSAAEATTAGEQDTQGTVGDEEDFDVDEYDSTSSEIYSEILGDFYDTYVEAKDEVDNISLRYAEMAIAEGKLLGSAVMLPLQSNGGSYAISRVVPNTVPYVLWGNDSDRFHNILVCTEPLTSEDRAALKSYWNENKGDGTYIEWAQNYLTEKGYTLKDTYSMGYSSDPQTWDILATSRSADSEAIVNTFDGLMEYDCEGNLQPALAESYEVSDDGLTYTFHLREDAVWVDSQGRKVANVVADDFVAGMQHMMDVAGGLEYLIEGVIVNASEYISGEITDFSEVGVKALDEYTVEYTLESKTHYFITMLGYNVFAPMSRTYYESKGGKFGAEFDESAADYTYGLTPDDIAYCGPYLVTNATEKNTIVFKANESYWNADNITIKTLTWLYNDGTDATKAYNDMKSGVLDGAGLNSSSLEIAKQDGMFDQYAYVSSTDATSFMAFFNVNRGAFANVNDPTTVVSSQTEEDAARTNAAMNNVHFRRALATSLDRGSYMAQVVGEDLKYASMRNSYTPGTFVELEEEVTVDINGTATTFPAGTKYGEIMQAQLDADGIEITVWDPTQDDGVGSSDYFDGWYNPEYAVAELNTAIDELAAEGVTIDADNPIQLDLPYFAGSEAYGNRANALKQSIESTLEGKVVVNLVTCATSGEWYYAGYYTDYGYEGNYDIYDVSGWGPDYGDPSTYLDTFLPDYSGYMVKCIGIY